MRILVVDDNQDAARSLAAILLIKGHVVRIAFNGSLAVKEAGMFKPHLVLLDIGMSGMDGLQSCTIMRRTMPHTMRIVAITGYDSPEDKQRTAIAGFDDHLVKPVGLDQLEAIIISVAARNSDEGCHNAGENH